MRVKPHSDVLGVKGPALSVTQPADFLGEGPEVGLDLKETTFQTCDPPSVPLHRKPWANTTLVTVFMS